ncbi:ABC transporter ATP-binding protein [Fluviispira sanaruensis]|uniref:Multidrug ABC transporter ATPase n=1 Tax=Fluviispira sanaruensis TaxID=2493639 RepID=A0A4P2VPL3_FLUSA|nr:ABC transporter ATP-binding protein [Fluviispira sanaruensis]BBH54160.1 multidrug ABC transporter ATPase [Fluviispira sanaruensis]
MPNQNYMNDEVHFTGKYSQSIYKTILMAIKPYKKKLLICLTVGFIGRGLLLANANIIGKWADTLCQNATLCAKNDGVFSSFTSANFLLLLTLFSITGFLFILFFRISVARMGTHSCARLYDETTLRVSRFPISFFDRNPLGRIITRFSSDYSAISRMSGGPLSEVFSITFDLILFLILTLIASLYFLPIIILSGALNYFVYKINKHKMRQARRDLTVIRGPVIAHFAETIQGAKIVRIFGKNKKFTDRFTALLDKFLVQKNKTNIVISIFSLQMAFVNVSILFVTGVFGIWLVQNKSVSIGSLGVAFTFISLTTTTIQVFFEWLSALEDALTGTERMNDYLCREIEGGSYLPSSTQFQTAHRTLSYKDELKIKKSKVLDFSNLNLEVKNLSLRYFPQQTLVLNNISFTVRERERIGVIGLTGSGKSSLIQALFHLYPFESGNIYINGYEADLGQLKQGARYIPLELFRSSISLISQEPTLFLGSFRENITINKSISDEMIIKTARIVGLGKYFDENKNALDMEILENGSNLSSGEKQLVCMARCLLKNSPIVLMDEATSSIDPFSEELLVNACKTYLKNRTQIIVAHRLSTIEDCDRILWLDSGRLIMDASPQTVLNAFKQFKETQYH